MGWDASVVPDPQDPATFERSKLDWSEVAGGRHAVLLGVYRRLAELRRDLPELTEPAFPALAATADEVTRVFTLERGELLIAVSFADSTRTLPATGELLFTTPATATLAGAMLTLPAHAGVLVRRSSSLS
jgi:maltooligosyltrehalose trehalohydrolase